MFTLEHLFLFSVFPSWTIHDQVGWDLISGPRSCFDYDDGDNDDDKSLICFYFDNSVITFWPVPNETSEA